ncbi:MAG TPA: PKD domain-containing protein [Bacteroidia bacterium]|nr:PKD domain-containing protein [Bacteroidia bacterium]
MLKIVLSLYAKINRYLLRKSNIILTFSGKSVLHVLFIFILPYLTKAQPVADFTANITIGCSPLVVSFTDKSTGNVKSWYWDFGNSNTSTLQNPQTTYTSPGKYTVKLTVSDGTNNHTVTKTDYIVVLKNPTAGFSVSAATVGCAPFTVSFIDQSNQGDAIISQWIWDFGDGNIGTQKNPTHTYSSPGSYSVSLHVIDIYGCSDTRFITNYIKVNSTPKAIFSNSQQKYCKTPALVSFTNSSTGNPTLSYLWDFGDTTTSTVKDPVHSYLYPGTFSVKLVVTDGNGCKDSIIKNNQIEIDNVKAYFKPDKDTVCTATFFRLNNQSQGAKNYFWNFGDGNTTNVPNPSYLYLNPGKYLVSLKVTNGSSCVDSMARYITVEQLTAGFLTSLPLYSCKPPLTVSFVNQSVNAVKYIWDFGDGDSSTDKNPVHVYTTPGVFTPSLTVIGAGGCVKTVISDKNVEIIPPQAAFMADSMSGCAPLHVTFTDRSNSKEPITSWHWDFDDGDTSDLQNPAHVFVKDTTYEVTLKITNSAGCVGISKLHITVGIKPIAGFYVKPDTSCAVDSVWFYSTSYTPSGKPIDFWQWTFGDGGSGSGDSCGHQHVDTGFMSTQLVVGYLGCYDTIKKDSVTYINGPISVISFQQDCKKPYDVTFVNHHKGMHHWEIDFGDGQKLTHLTVDSVYHKYTGKGMYTVNTVAYNDSTGCKWPNTVYVSVQEVLADFKPSVKHICAEDSFMFLYTGTGGSIHTWHFGDGTVSYESSPKHAYRKPGYYKVKLLSKEFGGCADSIEKTVRVYGITSDFSCDTFGCAPSAIRFFDKSVSDTAIYLWRYLFDDGQTSSLPNPVHTYKNKKFYSPTLIVENLANCNDTLTLTDKVIIERPAAGFYAYDKQLCWQDSVKFSNTSLGTGLKFLWNFGDGNTSSIREPVHHYSTSGKFTITLMVTDQNGCKDTLTAVNYIEVQEKLKTNFYADTIYANCYPLLVKFYDSSNIQDILLYEWDFGDKTPKSYLKSPAHSYTKPGKYDVSLFMVTNFGCTDTMIKKQYIVIKGPVADIGISPDTICKNQFTSLFITSKKDVYQFEWDFGDGVIAKNAPDSIRHQYKHAGMFFPKLLYMDSSKTCVKYAEDTLFVSSVNGYFTVSDSVGIIPLTVQFTGYGDPGIISWWYDFADSITSVLKNPEHTFKRPDTFFVKLVVTNTLGCKDTFTKMIIVEPLPPIVDMPKAFTPNGDGQNDKVYVMGAGIRYETLLDFSIYNRYGERVFHTTNPQDGWDGYYKGKLQNIDTYQYIVSVRLFDGQVVTLKGFIALIL